MKTHSMLLVDGSNLLFQMYYGMPARIVNAQGNSIQGVLGFVGALLKIIRRIMPSHVLVVFDGEHSDWRQGLDSSYKANRPDFSLTDESPYSQIKDVYSALDFLGIQHMETVDCEADDLIAAYVFSFRQELRITISSLDSDFFQLISDSVSVLRYRGKNTVVCTDEYLKSKYGISPKQYADFKSLTGDKSDNIRGADHVGPKTASLLLEEFGSLENVLMNAERIKKPSIRDSILRGVNQLRKSYQLIKLDANVPLPFTLDELRYCYMEITTNEVLKKIGLR